MSTTADAESVQFLHFSDAHLGHRQYNIEERKNDMLLSFQDTINRAIENEVEFVIFTGDLFQYGGVDDTVIEYAQNAISELTVEDIPMVAIRGNHDAELYNDEITWFEEMHSNDEYEFILLEANFNNPRNLFKKHDPNCPGRSSGYVDITDSIRIFGIQYEERDIPTYMSRVADEIHQINSQDEINDRVTILLAHFGRPQQTVHGLIGQDELDPLEQEVDYLALGHRHRFYEEDWVFNPGSIEAQSKEQFDWNLGYNLVEVRNNHVADPCRQLSKRRPFYEFEFDVTKYSTPPELKQGFRRRIVNQESAIQTLRKRPHFCIQGNPRDPLIEIEVVGTLRIAHNRFQQYTDFISSTIGLKRSIYPRITRTSIEEDGNYDVTNDLEAIISSQLNCSPLIRWVDKTESGERTWRDILRTFRSIILTCVFLLVLVFPLLIYKFVKIFSSKYRRKFYLRDYPVLIALDAAITQSFPLLFGYFLLGAIGAVLRESVNLGDIRTFLPTEIAASLLPDALISTALTLGTHLLPVLDLIPLIYATGGIALLAGVIVSQHDEIKNKFPRTTKQVAKYSEGLSQHDSSVQIESTAEFKYPILIAFYELNQDESLGTPTLQRVWKKL